MNEAFTVEAIRTITTLYPNDTLIEKAVGMISYFLSSTENNMIYFGIQGLINIVNVILNKIF